MTLGRSRTSPRRSAPTASSRSRAAARSGTVGGALRRRHAPGARPGRHRRVPAGGDDGARRRGDDPVASSTRRLRPQGRPPCSTAHADATVGGVLMTDTSGLRRLRVGPAARRAARGALRHRRRPARHRRRPDGQERHRLRPLPAAGRLARHARAASARSSCARVRAPRQPGGWPAPATPTPYGRAVPAVLACCGTARRRGCSSRATPPTSTTQARRAAQLGLRDCDGPPAAAPAPVVGARPDAVAPTPSARRSVRGRDRRRRRAPRDRRRPPRRSTARCGSCTAASRPRVRPDRPAATRAVTRCHRAAGLTREPRHRRRRARLVRVVRAVPAALPDVPGHRRRGPFAARAHRARCARCSSAPGSRRRATSSRRWRPACSAAAASPRARRACRSGTSWRPRARRWPRRGRRPTTVVAARRHAVLGHHRLLLAGSTALALAQRLRLVPSARLGLARAPPAAPAGAPPSAPADRRGRRHAVWLFTGCVMDAWQRDVHGAAQRVHRGDRRRRAHPRTASAGCCGALHEHAGSRRPRRVDCATRTMRGASPATRRSSSTRPAAAPCCATTASSSATDEARALQRPRARRPQLARRRASTRCPRPGRRRIAPASPCRIRATSATCSARTCPCTGCSLATSTSSSSTTTACAAAPAAPTPCCSPSSPGDIRERKLAAIARTGAPIVVERQPRVRPAPGRRRSRRPPSAPTRGGSNPWPVSSTTSDSGSRASPRSSPTSPSPGCASRSTPGATSCRSTSAASPALAARSTRPCRSSRIRSDLDPD